MATSVAEPAKHRKTILIVAFGHIEHDARIQRQIQAVRKQYNVILAARSKADSMDVSFVKIARSTNTIRTRMKRSYFRLTHNYVPYYRNKYGEYLVTQLHQIPEPIDAVLCNDLSALIGSLLYCEQRKIPCIFDAHEYEPGQFEEHLFKAKVHQHVCDAYLYRLSGMITVGDKIADLYQTEFSIARPTVVYNTQCLDKSIDVPSPVDPDRIRLVHHGVAQEGRRFDKLIEMMDLLDQRFYLTLMLMPSKHRELLKRMAAGHPRIEFVPPVTTDKIVPTLHQHDMGIFMLPSSCMSKRLAMPNKLFDSIQAGLGYATWPCSEEMALVVERYKLGVVSDNDTILSMAEVLNSLTAEQVEAFKANGFAARAELSFEVQTERLLELLNKTIAEYVPSSSA